MNRLTLVAAGALAVVLTAGAPRAVDTPGVTATELKIGNTSPYSGPASTYGVLGRLETAFVGMVNEQGGVAGQKVNYISLDDTDSPPFEITLDEDELSIICQCMNETCTGLIW